jgi:hypothetical protein
MTRDRDVRARYLRAMVACVGRDTDELAAETLNPRGAGARWCARLAACLRGEPRLKEGPRRGDEERARNRERPHIRPAAERREPVLVIEVRDGELLEEIGQSVC